MSKSKALAGIAAVTCITLYADYMLSETSFRNNGAWVVQLSKTVEKDLAKLKTMNRASRVEDMLKTLSEDPYDNTKKGDSFEKLKKFAKSSLPLYARRIDNHNRMVYGIDVETKTVSVIRISGHYERGGK